nr:MAG TPA: hypothetical protein [Caudoviricetes sp.]
MHKIFQYCNFYEYFTLCEWEKNPFSYIFSLGEMGESL